jgi:hypothetical protein
MREIAAGNVVPQTSDTDTTPSRAGAVRLRSTTGAFADLSANRHFFEAGRAALVSRRHFRYHLALVPDCG